MGFTCKSIFKQVKLNSFLYKSFCAKTCFETEANQNSEMGYFSFPCNWWFEESGISCTWTTLKVKNFGHFNEEITHFIWKLFPKGLFWDRGKPELRNGLLQFSLVVRKIWNRLYMNHVFLSEEFVDTSMKNFAAHEVSTVISLIKTNSRFVLQCLLFLRYNQAYV